MNYRDFLHNKRLSHKANGFQVIYIYGLVDPRTDQIRYVGKSIRPLARLQNHCNESGKCHRVNWIKLLKREGLRPTLQILEVVRDGCWQTVEREWIAHFRSLGIQLVNNTDGGDGVAGLPEETKARMRTVWLGRKHKPESLIKIGTASRGRTHSDSYKQMMRQIMKGRVFTQTHRQRLSIAVSKFTPEEEEAIHTRLKQGERVGAIANEVGVHRTTISKIKNGTYRRESERGLFA